MFPLRPPFMNFPFFNFYNYRKPTYYQSNLYRDSTYIKNFSHANSSSMVDENSNINSSNHNFPSNIAYANIKSKYNDNSSNESSRLNFEQKKPLSEPSEEYFFEVFGLKLYFDDILLICLLFFLYEEGVKDQDLFISLILLLLS